MLRRAWRKLIYDKILAQATRKTLTAEFETWLDQQDFSQACLDEEQQKLKRLKVRNASLRVSSLSD